MCDPSFGRSCNPSRNEVGMMHVSAYKLIHKAQEMLFCEVNNLKSAQRVGTSKGTPIFRSSSLWIPLREWTFSLASHDQLVRCSWISYTPLKKGDSGWIYPSILTIDRIETQ